MTAVMTESDAVQRPSPDRAHPDRGDPTSSVEMAGQCGFCDCDPELLNPWLLAAWLRSLPDQYTTLFDRAEPVVDLVARYPRNDRSASDHAAHAAHVLQTTAEAVARGLTSRTARTTSGGQDTITNTSDLALVLTTLVASTKTLTTAIGQISTEAWLLGFHDHHELKTLELIRQAIHEAAHHLAEATSACNDAHRQPATTSGGSGPRTFGSTLPSTPWRY